MAKHRPKLKYVAGGDRKTHPNKRKVESFHRFQGEGWYKFLRDERPYAAIANRRLRFATVNELLSDRPPSVVRKEDSMRVYLFRTGEDRDLFVETFHHHYAAKAIVIGERHAS